MQKGRVSGIWSYRSSPPASSVIKLTFRRAGKEIQSSSFSSSGSEGAEDLEVGEPRSGLGAPVGYVGECRSSRCGGHLKGGVQQMHQSRDCSVLNNHSAEAASADHREQQSTRGVGQGSDVRKWAQLAKRSRQRKCRKDGRCSKIHTSGLSPSGPQVAMRECHNIQCESLCTCWRGFDSGPCERSAMPCALSTVRPATSRLERQAALPLHSPLGLCCQCYSTSQIVPTSRRFRNSF